MQSVSLLSICISAFEAVFVLLAFLAFVMFLITRFFPVRESETDAAVVAAISSAMRAMYPGTRITKVEELR